MLETDPKLSQGATGTRDLRGTAQSVRIVTECSVQNSVTPQQRYQALVFRICKCVPSHSRRSSARVPKLGVSGWEASLGLSRWTQVGS